MRPPYFQFLIYTVSLLSAVKSPILSASDAPATFDKQVAPIMEEYCIGCHGPDKQKNDLRIDTLNRDFINGRDTETWHDILDVLNLGDMPPEDEPQPTETERQAIVDWITTKMIHAIDEKRSTGGLGVLRRLTRYEYNNTMTELLGIELDYASDLPPETNSHDGFQNNGSIMGMSAMQMEYYLQAAQRGLSMALVDYDEPEQFTHFGTCNVDRRADRQPEKVHTSNIQPGNCFMTRLMEYPTSGPVTIRVTAHAKIPEGKGPPRMRVKLGIRADTYMPGGQVGEDIDIVATEDAPGVYEFTGQLEQFPVLKTPSNFPGLLVNVHNVYDDGSDAIELFDKRLGEQEKKLNTPDPKQPWLIVQSVEFIAPDYKMWPPEHHQTILFKGAEIPKNETKYAKQILTRFMKRAYRRPATNQEIEEVLGFYREIRPQYETFIETMRQALSMVLISPQFLYLLEPSPPGKGIRDLTPYEVASRLSYFLWSTMPDDELLELAANKHLLKSNVLNDQIQRMLEAPQAKRFVEQFTDQWLDLPALDRVAVNPQFYPEFKDRAKTAMRLETQHFFAEILHNDLSAMNFVDSDFTMLNERLASHYGIEGVKGTSMTRVPLKPEYRRGGLITQGSMLVGNSTGEDSHPIKRAVWILERLLDDPPSPPPANVPALDSETPGFAKLTLKDQLGVHREDKACVSCHLKIDPWGIPLEHYDATGLYRTEALRLTAEEKGQTRTQVEKAPLDASDTMTDGHTIDGADQLKAYILTEKKDAFARALVVKMLAYGLGRSLEFTDEPIIDDLSSDFEAHDYRLDHLISSIVTSKLFLSR
ncbi:MAG: hypothetical protein ACI92G_000820 [Candidatus Pelagisphaera sp.]|jgi:hypothetical protein